MTPTLRPRAAALAAASALWFAPAAAPAEGPGLTIPADVFVPATAAVKLPDDVFARPPGDDAVDVVLIGGSRAAVVRVHVTLGGKSYKTAWGDLVVRLHGYLDRNDDGVLTTDEANRAPWTNLLQSPFNGNGNPIRAGMKPVAIDSSPRDGKVSFEELVSYLQGSQSYEPIGAQAGPPPDPRFEAVFDQFDHDGDKALAPAEMSQTDALVARLDRDEDETISLDEFTPDRSPLTDRFGRQNVNGGAIDAQKSPALPLATPDQVATAAARLLRTYGEAGGKLIRAEPLGADPAAFAAADGNGDRALDLTELKRYLAAPPGAQLELVVTLPPSPGGAARIEKAPVPAGAAATDVMPSRPSGNGALLVDYAGSEIEFRAGDTQNNNGNFLEQQFKQADADKDGTINAGEARGNFFLQRMHPVADRNGDGKMTEAEMKAYLSLNNAATDVRTLLTVSDRGVAIYEKLDTNRDNRLSLRELRGVTANLADLDRDRDGRVSLTELPRRSQISFGRGPVQNRNVNVVVQNPNAANAARPAGSPAPPVWFVGMDRNRDGDVSPREFLGMPEQFREFDADGDGLIDANEAARLP